MAPLRSRPCCLALLGVAAVVASAAVLAVVLSRAPRCALPRYRHAALAADTRTCSQVGRDILQQSGSAVDAAIAALICTSVLNPQSMGFGGGVIFTIYNASTGNVEVLNARERAPRQTSSSLLDQCAETLLPGPQWIAVPGELRGYEEAHKRYGKLPWEALFEPTIKILDPGIRIPQALSRFLNHTLIQSVLNKTALGELFRNDQGAILRTGDPFRWPALVGTLRAVAEKGAKEFYVGKTAEKLVQDVRKAGGTLTLEDLKNYHVDVVSPLNVSLGEYTAYSAPRPAAGPVLFFILNVLKGFNFTKESVSTPSKRAEAFHYIAEALKFANSQRAKVDDPTFSTVGQDVIRMMISDAFAARIRQQIDNQGDHPASHYDPAQLGASPFGTSHVAVLAEDGSAVSATSTINHPFGSMVYSKQTGIILNNELADFCMKQSSRTISEGEMPPSSMTPSILISRDGQSKLVIGGSGGQLIVPAVALAIANKLWFGYDLDDAIKEPLLYVTSSNSIEVEENFSQFWPKAI
ncbi:glutathione hydrolase 5 proenzyme isoform X2 [Rhineura floridana]|uniref:glutathione hydrolase 5 proenzyme isoform X2 n=1 Tax=Rhineura floridana TaxID=261503 RepID=UPI002AC82355|nr:glutathione hydrolase 5 proenzyme isoform X2 [Rhineura floridana]